MLRRLHRLKVQLTLIAVGGSPFILGDCDPTIQATVEDGIIDLSTTLLQQGVQALILAATEAANAGA